MKKLYFYLLMTLSVFALTSCDTDERIANYLINGNWKGNLQNTQGIELETRSGTQYF